MKKDTAPGMDGITTEMLEGRKAVAYAIVRIII